MCLQIKKVKFYKRQLHSCVQVAFYRENCGFTSLSFIVDISFLCDIQFQPLKWLNCVCLYLQGLQLLKTKIKLVVINTQWRTGHPSHGYSVCMCSTSKTLHQTTQPMANGNSCNPFSSKQTIAVLIKHHVDWSSPKEMSRHIFRICNHATNSRHFSKHTQSAPLMATSVR